MYLIQYEHQENIFPYYFLFLYIFFFWYALMYTVMYMHICFHLSMLRLRILPTKVDGN